jgi:hypothetical protein
MLFDDNWIVTHVFIKQKFRAVEVVPPPLPPHRAVQGVGSFKPPAVALINAM